MVRVQLKRLETSKRRARFHTVRCPHKTETGWVVHHRRSGDHVSTTEFQTKDTACGSEN